MPKFNFNLQKLLDYKDILLKEEISKIQQLNTQIEDCQEKISGINNRMNALGQAIETKGRDTLQIEVLIGYKRYINDLNGLKSSFTKQKNNMELILDKTRNKAISLQKEHKTIDLLKEKKFYEFKKEQEYQEQSLLDDLVCMRRTI
ncbi:flagellar export protein FliJ [Alkalicella caledoniensis]|uniref:Flagellar FliJ protein n=1 Tax=Alkalicella caledoniensis TaxID=2731377 RepID=A0A7G9WCK7_ALKCA|nr:flagellar export protein FliJ [Alkalicella caledoniensis]QNO16419.1 flagellar export protein FliJ [Alkalicella caledoniensis]